MKKHLILHNRRYCTASVSWKYSVPFLSLIFFLVIAVSARTQPLGDMLFRPVLGEQKVLFIRVNYPDDPTIVLTDDRAPVHADGVAAVMEANSYGNLAFDIDITPVLTMPQPKAFYQLDDRLWIVRLRSDALKIAENAGFDVDLYDREAIFTVKVWSQPYKGTGGFNGRTVITKFDNIAHTCHEFGHTFDWRHANFWQVSGTDPFSLNGELVEYGDKFDIMGDFLNPHHYNPWYKRRVNWLPPESILTVTESGNYSIQGLELSPLSGQGDAYTALLVRRTPLMEFVLYYRSQEAFASEGALISLTAPTNRAPSALLDMTPGSQMSSSQDYKDAALLVGQTVQDNLSGIEFTLLEKDSNGLVVNVTVPEEPLDILPRINFISPEFSLTIQGAVDYEVTAYDPDIGNTNGAGIDTVKFSLGYIAGDNPYIDEGTEFIEVASGFSTSPPYVFHVETTDFPDECYRMVARVVSQNGGKNIALLNHIIDNTGPSITSPVEGVEEAPGQIQLDQNIPNPFSQSTTINYYLNRSGQVILSIYDMFGKKVETLVQSRQNAGRHSVSWNASTMNAGLYFYHLQVGEVVATKRMLLFK